MRVFGAATRGIAAAACLLSLAGLDVSALVPAARAGQVEINRLLQVTPEAGAAFQSPYYLYLPRWEGGHEDSARILVFPNNTGRCNDTLGVHDRRALRQVLNLRDLADDLRLAILVPVFPRPQAHPEIYTHALDRDALQTTLPGLRRLDLQLLAMIEDARGRCGAPVHGRVLMLGQSASGMFVNRFTLLHPEAVEAAAVGSPGGWPIAPLSAWQGRLLRYPVGMADVVDVAGAPFDAARLRAVEMFFFMGDRDENDSVPFDDGYDPVDRDLVMNAFGRTPLSRWDTAKQMYAQANGVCTFKLYPGVGHTIDDEMWSDIRGFLKRHR